MNKSGPIVVVEDDVDDRYLMKLVLNDLKYSNEVLFFGDGDQALDYLRSSNTHPFLVLSDINLPRLNGFDLKKHIQTDKDLCQKCIPFIFYSTYVNEQAVDDAYKMSIQGFFRKPSNFEDLKATIRTIIEYWTKCYSPGNYVAEALE
jgi:CheY-like chemotaxis protein